jgi:hypothetical protein
VSNAEIDVADADSDFVSFEDAASGGAVQFSLVFTVADDYQADSLWDQAWSNTGSTVAFILSPYGGTPSATDPAFSGNAIISLPSGKIIGGGADASASAALTTDFTWVCTAKPTRITS